MASPHFCPKIKSGSGRIKVRGGQKVASTTALLNGKRTNWILATLPSSSPQIVRISRTSDDWSPCGRRPPEPKMSVLNGITIWMRSNVR